jgi:hypothetical protein
MPARFSDDDDWVGTPPEGRHTRDRADPGHWARQWRMQALAFGGLFVLVVVVVLLIALR